MDEPIHMYFYEGHYGPTILFPLHHTAQVRRMRELFDRLARDAKKNRYTLEAPEFVLHQLNGVVLAIEDAAPEQNVHFAPGLVAEWCDTKSGWMRNALLVKRLEQHAEPGHQYLTSPESGDVTVITSFKESLAVEHDR